MKLRVLIVALALTLGACSKITEENFARIEEGMSEQEVVSILGAPTESNSVNILGISVLPHGGSVAKPLSQCIL